MTAALKHLPMQETIVLEDDSNTMIGLAGKRVVPILIKDDGETMLESMDMVLHVDGIGEPVLKGPVNDEIVAWETRITPKAARLTQPRYPLLSLPEFATAAALDHYMSRKRKTLGDLVELRANTRQHLSELMPDLEELDRRIESPAAINGTVSVDDVRVLPLLRSLAVVKELRFPRKVGEYFQTMMAKTGYRPLPSV